jgi:hypothetical protein
METDSKPMCCAQRTTKQLYPNGGLRNLMRVIRHANETTQDKCSRTEDFMYFGIATFRFLLLYFYVR